MAGHSKWAQIKRQKGAEDVKRSKLFSLLARAITLESKKCGGDVNSPSLRAAIEKARKQNVPNENIERAVNRGIGSDAQSFEEFTCEAYGPGGTAIIIEGLTDSRNRTLAEIKHLLNEYGAALAAPGAATWAFTKTADGWVPQNDRELEESENARLTEIIAALEEHDDIRTVSTNARSRH